MKTEQFSLKSKYLKKFLTFPVFIFTGIILVALISFFGRRTTISQGEVLGTGIDCTKTGANGGGFPKDASEAKSVFSKMKTLGLHWYQGLIDQPGAEQQVADSINTASDYGINIIVRICWGSKNDWDNDNEDTWHCGFTDPAVYVESLKYISNLTDNKEFWAIAGHNEPNALEKRNPDLERSFMEGVIDGLAGQSNIHLLSPIMDLHASTAGAIYFVDYLNSLNQNGYLSRLDGIAGNTYEFAAPTQTIKTRIEEASKYGLPLYITETGIMDGSFDSFRNNYRWATTQNYLQAILFFKPKGLMGDGEGVSLQDINAILPDCGDLPADSLINECAFEDYPLSPCETAGNPGHLGMGRGLVLEYERGAPETWTAEWIATATIENLPAFSYYASSSYEGDEEADYPSQSVNLNRLSMGCVFDRSTNERICYDSTLQFPGYGLITTGEGRGVIARPEYHDGSGVLTSCMGDYSDFTAPLRIPRQFVLDDEVFPDTSQGIQLETQKQSEGNYISNLLESLKNWIKDLFGWGDRITEKHCQGQDFPIDGLWEGNATSGQETVIAEGSYDFDIERFVANSSLANTVKNGSCKKEGSNCKIYPENLDACNNCYLEYEQIPNDPNNLEAGYYNGDVTFADCPHIDYWTGKIFDPEGLIYCINTEFEGKLGVRHHIPPRGFKLGGAVYILETYWKKIQMLTPERRICHNKNIGIEAFVQGQLYDKIDDCGGGGEDSGNCGGYNLVKNYDYSWGTRKPPQTEKQQWEATPVYWFPWWNPSPPGNADPVMSTEINAIADQISDDRGSDGHYAHIFTPEYAQRMDAGIFQEIWFGDEDGNPEIVSTGTRINITARGQGNNSYVGDSHSDYIVNSEFKLSVGVMYGGAIDSLAANGPLEENFQFGGFDGLSHKISGSQDHGGPNPPGFIDLEGSFTLDKSTDKITIFLQGVDTNGSTTSTNKLQSFWDNVCVALPDDPLIVNISPEEQAEAFPWEGDMPSDSDFCEPDPPFTMGCSFDWGVHESAHPELKAYFPYFGSIIHGFSYLDIQQPSISPDTTDIPLCEDADDDTIICFCEIGRPDPMAEYLVRVGILNATESALGGIDREHHAELLLEGAPGTDEEGSPIDDNDYVPDIDPELWAVLQYVSDLIKEKTGNCIPREMIAAIMSIETNTKYTKDQLNSKFPDPTQNSDWCSRINRKCTGTNTTANATDKAISDELLSIKQHPNCGKPIPESASQECKDERTVVDDLTMGCCDVRGPMQFDVNTWLGYKNYVPELSTNVLEHFEFDTSSYDKPQRVRLIDAIIAAALKLKTNCNDWEENEYYTVRKRAGCYVGGCNAESSYAYSVLERYKKFKGTSDGDIPDNDLPDPDSIVTPDKMGHNSMIYDNLPVDALTISMHAQCPGTSDICRAYPYNMKRTFSRLTPSVTDILYNSDWSDNIPDFGGYIRLAPETTKACQMFGNFIESDGFILTSDGIPGHGACNTMSMVYQVADRYGLDTFYPPSPECKKASYRMPLIEPYFRLNISCPSCGPSITNNTGKYLELHWQRVGDSLSLWIWEAGK